MATRIEYVGPDRTAYVSGKPVKYRIAIHEHELLRMVDRALNNKKSVCKAGCCTVTILERENERPKS